MEALQQFGLQPILLIAQVVNFLLLLFLLKKFLYGPIVKMLDERKSKIAKSMKDAEAIEKKLAQIEEERERANQKTAIEMRQIIDEATKAAEQIRAEARSLTQEDAAKILDDAKAQISSEREKMQQEIKTELATLVTIGLQKISGKVLTKKDQQDIISKSVKDL